MTASYGPTSMRIKHDLGILDIFRQTQKLTMLTLGIGTIFIDQLLTFQIFKTVHTKLPSKSSTAYHQISEVL